jgi:hypothetical protein
MRPAHGDTVVAMPLNFSRLQALGFVLVPLFGCSQKIEPAAPPVRSAAAALAKVEVAAKEAPAALTSVAALPAEPKPLPRRVFKKKPKADEIARQLAGEAPVEPKTTRTLARAAQPVEEIVALDDPDERLDPSDPHLSDREFYRTVSDWGGFSECLAKERTRREIGSGALRLLYKIGPRGNVLKVRAITPSGDGAHAIIPCVEKKAAKMRFTPLTDPMPVKKIAKFVWVANGTTVDVDRSVRSL